MTIDKIRDFIAQARCSSALGRFGTPDKRSEILAEEVSNLSANLKLYIAEKERVAFENGISKQLSVQNIHVVFSSHRQEYA